MLMVMGITVVSYAIVFILSGKRLVELEKPWQCALLLFLYPIFHFVYLYLVLMEDAKWEIAER